MRALVQEKNNIVAERGNIERELKALKATSAKLVKATSPVKCQDQEDTILSATVLSSSSC